MSVGTVTSSANCPHGTSISNFQAQRLADTFDLFTKDTRYRMTAIAVMRRFSAFFAEHYSPPSGFGVGTGPGSIGGGSEGGSGAGSGGGSAAAGK